MSEKENSGDNMNFTRKKVTNRLHVSVRLSNKRSQMTPICGKNKKWRNMRSSVCNRCSYHNLTSSEIYYWTNAQQH